jgi:putative flippase GtrA
MPFKDMCDFPKRGVLHRWLAFNAVGAAGIPVQLAALAFFMGPLGWHYLIATAAAVETAVLHNFVWHELWTWADRATGGLPALANRLGRFHLTNGALSIGGNLLLMKLLVGCFGMHYAAANLLAITACSVVNFFAGEHLVFTGARGGGSEALQKQWRG